MKLSDVMSTKEATERWGLSQQTVKQLCIGAQGRPPGLVVDETCHKTGGTWIVTRSSMERLYGPKKENI